MPNDSERALAIFVDFDNIAQGFRRTDRFDIQRVLKRMVEKGKIVAKKTYADWSRYLQYTGSLHEAAFELVEIPKRSLTGKNSADIRLCVDAMDLAYNKPHIDTFVIVSGDSDFTPLVSKLKEMGKHVIGLGMTNSTSDLLRDNCDEFIYYEDLEVEKAESPKVNLPVPDTRRKALELLLEACTALRRENKEVLWASMIKETMKRKKPSFNETYHGFNTFSALLEDAQAQGLVELERDEKRGTYTVVRFGEEITRGGSPLVRKEPPGRSRGKDFSTPTPSKRTPLSAAPARKPVHGRPERSLPPERTVTPPVGPRVDDEIKPRVPQFQAFSEFAQEASQFIGQPKSAPLLDDFAGFGSPYRSKLSSTAEEVMANIHESRQVTERPPPAPVVEEEEPVAVPEPRIEEPEDKERFKKGRRRRGKGKDRPGSEEQPGSEGVEPTEAVKIDERPISFDDVPFVATTEDPKADEEAIPSFADIPPEAPQPKPQRRRLSEVFPPAPVPEPMAATPEPSQPEQRSGFGFGIFDE